MSIDSLEASPAVSLRTDFIQQESSFRNFGQFSVTYFFHHFFVIMFHASNLRFATVFELECQYQSRNADSELWSLIY